MQTARIYEDTTSSELALVEPLVKGFKDQLEKVDDNASTSTGEKEQLEIPKQAVLRVSKPLKGNFKLLQMWEGRVASIDNDHYEFTAIIQDKTNSSMPDEELTLSIEEIPPSDLSLLSSGAVFYWSIGYADYPGRPRSRESRVRFRRLQKWQPSDLSIAEDRGKKLADFFTPN